MRATRKEDKARGWMDRSSSIRVSLEVGCLKYSSSRMRVK